MIKEIDKKEQPPKEEVELTPEQKADEELMQDFFDAEDDIVEIEF